MRKLALHLAAQPHPLDKPQQLVIDQPAQQDPEEMGEDKARCEQLMAELEGDQRCCASLLSKIS